MAWRWLRAKWGAGRGFGWRQTSPGRDEIRVALEQRGVPVEFSGALAERTAVQIAGLAAPAREALLDGVAIAVELQHSTRDQLTRNLRGVREVERMMGAFSGELSKLDEVLGVLSAYVRRMKSSGDGLSDRVLH